MYENRVFEYGSVVAFLAVVVWCLTATYFIIKFTDELRTLRWDFKSHGHQQNPNPFCIAFYMESRTFITDSSVIESIAEIAVACIKYDDNPCGCVKCNAIVAQLNTRINMVGTTV